ncbi:hypothetical protein [Granulicella sp. L60]|uniref:hypothetical protein n=1 Tax=Granulicella sp. L60 TaxID=1641866 RepID=UPI00131B3A0F|nr:hypothetical protein [Granulicella sp. L60]
MKERTGVGFGLGLTALLAAGVAFYSNSGSANRPAHSEVPMGAAKPKRSPQESVSRTIAPYVGGCTAYLPPLTSAQQLTEQKSGKENTPGDDSRSDAYKVIQTFVNEGEPIPVPRNEVSDRLKDQLTKPDQNNETDFHLRYIVAVVPDPRHTHLSLEFDRFVEAIEGAAQDEEYVYDSSWLPWSRGTPQYPLRADEELEEQYTEKVEGCPGVLLFRKALDTGGSPFQNGLVVFLVGEQPTGGLRLSEWENSILWLQQYAWRKDRKETLQVLGPTYSGTLPSLEQRLRTLVPTTASLKANSNPHAAQKVPDLPRPVQGYVYSGSVQSCSSIKWFKDTLMPMPIEFAAFSENESVKTFRLLRYFKTEDIDPEKVAIISEDETAYGSLPKSAQVTTDTCKNPLDSNVMKLYYPRDISALRTAYQENSLLSRPAGGGEHEAVQTVLPSDLSAGSWEQGDSVPSYSKQEPLNEEAQLYGIVSQLREKHTEDIILRCSNPLDYLFLIRFLHRTYPEGRVITVGSDLLFRREVDTTEFRGTLTVTDYTLTPHSAEVTGTASSLKDGIREPLGSDVESLELAMRALLRLVSPEIDPKTRCPQTQADPPPNLLWSSNCWQQKSLPYFDHALWMKANPENSFDSPDVWLTVIGRDGYWPVAALNKDAVASMITDKQSKEPLQTIAALQPPCQGPLGLSGKLPVTWNLFAFLSVGPLLLHLTGVWNPSFLRFLRLDNAFETRNDWRWGLVFSTSCTLAFFPLWSLLIPVLEQSNVPDPVLSYGYAAVLIIWWVLIILRMRLREQPLNWKVVLGFTLVSLSLACCLSAALTHDLSSVDKSPFSYRAMHLTNGVSPLLSLWILLVGLYLWSLQSLNGNTLVSEERPLLPPAEPLKSPDSDSGTSQKLASVRSRISDAMAQRIEMPARMFEHHWGVILPPIIFLAAFAVFHNEMAISSFERPWLSRFFCLSLGAMIALIVLEASSVVITWSQLNRLLRALSRTPLRRTFRAIRGFSGTSLWHISGDVPRSQYQILERQIESAETVCRLYPDSRFLPSPEDLLLIRKMVIVGNSFRLQYNTEMDRSAQWNAPLRVPDTDTVYQMREVIKDSVAALFHGFLEQAWHAELPERTKQNLEAVGEGKNPKETDLFLPLSNDETVRAAEEFVCLSYVSYIQNILARIRSLIVSIVLLYVAAGLAVAVYPFSPRPQIASFLLIFLLGLSITVSIVYSGMERDCILSDITNTESTLGWEFYQKLALFLVPTIFALLTAQFPELTDSFLGWVQPGLSAVK